MTLPGEYGRVVPRIESLPPADDPLWVNHPLRAAALAVGSIVLLTTACGGGSRLPVVHVVEKDFSIVAPRTAPRGDVRIVVENRGPVSHELLLIEDDRLALPVRTDRFTIDEDALALDHRLVTDLEPRAPGTSVAVRVHLKPGRYLLLCNMAGHYAVGMHRVLIVR